MKMFRKSPRPPCPDRHDSLLQELAMTTMAEHATDPVHSNRSCRVCDQNWPCPSYRLAQAAEVQARHYGSRSSCHLWEQSLAAE